MLDPGTRQVRTLIRALLRIAATTAMVIAAIIVATYWPSFSNQRRLAAAGMNPVPHFTDFFAVPLWLIAGGVWMLILDRSLLWWLVPGPSGKCPQCKYDLRGLSGDKCPECGLVIR